MQWLTRVAGPARVVRLVLVVGVLLAADLGLLNDPLAEAVCDGLRPRPLGSS
jgi:hypothetical protein